MALNRRQVERRQVVQGMIATLFTAGTTDVNGTATAPRLCHVSPIPCTFDIVAVIDRQKAVAPNGRDQFSPPRY